MAPTGLTATPLAQIEQAKKLAKAQGFNESTIGTADLAATYIDAISATGADQTAAITKLDKTRHKHG